jgi:hypothetical protein
MRNFFCPDADMQARYFPERRKKGNPGEQENIGR